MESTSILHTVYGSKKYTEEDREYIFSKFQKKSFKKGEEILQAGKTANEYWFVQSGMFRSFAVDRNGNEVTTNFYSKGDIVIDWTSFFMRTPTRETIVALCDGHSWHLDFNTFQQLFHSIQPFREDGRSRLVQSYFELKKHRISLITDSAMDRYLFLQKEKPEVVQNVSLKHIASYLGITAPSLSRIRKEMTK